jgi:hypothetical protein
MSTGRAGTKRGSASKNESDAVKAPKPIAKVQRTLENDKENTAVINVNVVPLASASEEVSSKEMHPNMKGSNAELKATGASERTGSGLSMTMNPSDMTDYSDLGKESQDTVVVLSKNPVKVSSLQAISTPFLAKSGLSSSTGGSRDGVEIASGLEASDVHLDPVVLNEIMRRSGLTACQKKLRHKPWTLLTITGESICVDDLRDCMFHLLHHYILSDMYHKTPYDSMLKHMVAIGHFVPGRRLIDEAYYDTLDALGVQVIKNSFQRVHEHYKVRFREAFALLDYRGGIRAKSPLSWLDIELIAVLRHATISWSSINTFADQQIAKNMEDAENGVLE